MKMQSSGEMDIKIIVSCNCKKKTYLDHAYSNILCHPHRYSVGSADTKHNELQPFERTDRHPLNIIVRNRKEGVLSTQIDVNGFIVKVMWDLCPGVATPK